MDLKEWIGKSETVVRRGHRDTLRGAVGDARPRRRCDRPPGTPLPALWHWLYFLPLHRQSEIGPDGHAKRGGFLPPVPLPRRMWAGSQFEFHAPLRVGDAMTRVSTIEDVTEKSGRTGRLVFVKVRHEIRRGDETAVALTEFHDIVYREAAKARRRRAAAEAGAASQHVGAQVGSRRRAAVPLLGADVQRPSHPLRPPLRHAGRRLPGADRPRPADRDAAARPAAPSVAGRRGRALRVPRGAPALRHQPVLRLRRAAAGRQDVPAVGAGPRGLRWRWTPPRSMREPQLGRSAT